VTDRDRDRDREFDAPSTFADACEAILADPGGEHSLDTTLAPLYDRMVGDAAEHYAAQARLVRSTCPPETDAVLDVGCGVGGLLPHLERTFGEVVGLDPREELLRPAARRSARAVLVSGDARTVDLGRPFDAVFALDYVTGRCTDGGDVAALFENLYRHLGPGGTVVCDAVAGPEAVREDSVQVYQTDAYRLERAVDVVDSGPDRLAVVADHRVTDRADGRRATTTDRREVRTFAAADLRASLSAAGFAAASVDDEAGEAGALVAAAHRPVETG
jgi:SAM-dependent methyltransferase